MGVYGNRDEFRLDSSGWLTAQMARQTARLLLQQPGAEPELILALGRVLHALDRLPLVTRRINCSYGVIYDWAPNDPYGAKTVECFEVSSEHIRAVRAGYERNPHTGGDSFSYLDCDPVATRDSIVQNLREGAQIELEDYSDFEIDDYNLF